MGSLGASCFHTLSDDTRDLSKEEWDSLRFGMVCTEAENFAEWKAALLKFCESTKKCTFEVKKVVNQLQSKLERHQRKVLLARGNRKVTSGTP